MEYVDKLLIMKDDDDNAENNIVLNKVRTLQAVEVHSLHTVNRHLTSANAGTVNLWLKRLRTNTSHSYNLRSVPGPV